jgi:hypothetical protein
MTGELGLVRPRSPVSFLASRATWVIRPERPPPNHRNLSDIFDSSIRRLRHPNRQVPMVPIFISVSTAIQALPEVVYSILSDYSGSRSLALPEGVRDYRVEKGGTGEGTLARFTFHGSGSTIPVGMRVAEPEPGRVITESALSGRAVRTLSVVPAGPAGGSLLTLELLWNPGGASGLLERMFSPARLRRAFAGELTRIAALAEAETGSLVLV